MKNIEIEFRSRFDRKKYLELKRFLSKNSKDLGKDDKNVYFFIISDKLLKVSENKQSAKITLKLNKIGQGNNFEEIEFPIAIKDSIKALKLFQNLGFTKIVQSFQKRNNYYYKGVEVALKYSKNWGYHAELEIVIHKIKDKKPAEAKISKIADIRSAGYAWSCL